MLVGGGGATGVQVASIFYAFGSHVELFEACARIPSTEDEGVAAVVGGRLPAGGHGRP
jgi:pyruvate/2-oxoglutarate dehydrogenase complex dihydrolipoamide dehydrogenase (E3) component